MTIRLIVPAGLPQILILGASGEEVDYQGAEGVDQVDVNEAILADEVVAETKQCIE